MRMTVASIDILSLTRWQFRYFNNHIIYIVLY